MELVFTTPSKEEQTGWRAAEHDTRRRDAHTVRHKTAVMMMRMMVAAMLFYIFITILSSSEMILYSTIHIIYT